MADDRQDPRPTASCSYGQHFLYETFDFYHPYMDDAFVVITSDLVGDVSTEKLPISFTMASWIHFGVTLERNGERMRFMFFNDVSPSTGTLTIGDREVTVHCRLL